MFVLRSKYAPEIAENRTSVAICANASEEVSNSPYLSGIVVFTASARTLSA